ncbi:MAG: replicative DNA helicase [Bacteroidetes bacterium HGW-Bacteroidetes-12]|nr:MAG: replicative DNA helicase [Bacteroidetes bacterium HGW-Bacteroidetes-12]
MANQEQQNKARQRNLSLNKIGSTLEHGKLQPQAIDLEEAVLGALMLEKEAVNTAIDILQPQSFYKDSHQKIFATIQYLFQSSQAVDILTVTNELKKRGELEIVGGAYFVTQLTNRVASAANIEFHARVIAQKYIQRELIRISSEIITDAYDETTDVFTLLDKAESSLFSVAEGNIRKSFESMTDLIRGAMEQIETAKNKETGVIGVPSGFTALDRITSGWQPSDLVIIAARPAMGKTSYVLSLARNAAVDFKIPVAFFSLEMSSIQLVTRLISAESGISSGKLRSGNLRNDEIQQIQSRITGLADAPLFIDDTAGLSVFELRAKARRLKAKHNIQLLIIDYLQLMSGNGEGGKGAGNREQEISMISRSLKSIAKELSIPVLALSQLSRAVETRGGDKKPQLSDLRESGSIEQDADMVQFIHRPSYYQIFQDEDGNSTEGKATILIAKHRNGAVCDVHLRFIDELAKFEDFDNNSTNFDDSQFATMPIGTDFDTNPTLTLPSKMNDSSDDFDYGNGNPDEAPF